MKNKNSRYLDFQSTMEYLAAHYPDLANQERLALAVGCSSSNISQRSKENRFLKSWLKKLNDEKGYDIDIDKVEANVLPFDDSVMPFNPREASSEYWFYDMHPSKKQNLGGLYNQFGPGYFSDLVAVNRSFLKKKGVDPYKTFLFIDNFGTIAPRVLTTDTVLVHRTSTFTEDGVYVLANGQDLKLAELEYLRPNPSGGGIAMIRFTQSAYGIDKHVEREKLERDIVGKVLLRVTAATV